MSLSLSQIQAAVPSGGLYDGGWQFSPEPLRLSKSEVRFLTTLGHPLAKFQQASDDLYRRSVQGKAPAWIAALLDAGKPQWLRDWQRDPASRAQQPRVIRPDLILAENGFALTELDSVPGGIGITAWLSEVYSAAGFSVLGGERGMLDGFASVLPENGAILISKESGDYRRELEWLLSKVGGGREILQAEDYRADGRSIYRFFEWFDWESVPAAPELAARALRGELSFTPPPKPHLEEKLWLALFCTPGLRSLWEKELRGSHLERLKEIVPQGWIVDPAPLPPQAALPKLEVNSWQEVGAFSQKQRRLVLKISGFNELAWGSRGVFIGHDLPTSEWTARLNHALDSHDTQPWVMQEFREARVIEHPVFREDGSVQMMKGRVRLCPYYFTNDAGETHLAGCLATFAPVDKKKIHGMKDAVLLPCAVEE